MSWHWWAHHLGTDNGSGGYYLWYSGFGANFAELAVIGGVIAIYRRHECHEETCHRLGRHTVVDPTTGEHILRCRRCHQHWKTRAPIVPSTEGTF